MEVGELYVFGEIKEGGMWISLGFFLWIIEGKGILGRKISMDIWKWLGINYRVRVGKFWEIILERNWGIRFLKDFVCYDKKFGSFGRFIECVEGVVMFFLYRLFGLLYCRKRRNRIWDKIGVMWIK